MNGPQTFAIVVLNAGDREMSTILSLFHLVDKII
jgi:hypothetical protein